MVAAGFLRSLSQKILCFNFDLFFMNREKTPWSGILSVYKQALKSLGVYVQNLFVAYSKLTSYSAYGTGHVVAFGWLEL